MREQLARILAALSLAAVLAAALGFAWVQNPPQATQPAVLDAEAVAAGRALYESQGCMICHAVGGEKNDMGPPLLGLYGRPVVVTENGKEKTITADDAYIEESITDPGKLLVKGYDNTMPPYTDFSKEQMRHILEYTRSIAADPGAVHTGVDGSGHDGHGQETGR